MTDPSGAAVPNASVTLTGPNNSVKVAQTDNSGNYTVNGLAAPASIWSGSWRPASRCLRSPASIWPPAAPTTLDVPLSVAGGEAGGHSRRYPADGHRSRQERRRAGAQGRGPGHASGRSRRSAGGLAGAGRTGRRARTADRFSWTGSATASFRPRTPSARSASTPILFRPNSTSPATAASKSSPSPARTRSTAWCR